MTDVTHGNSCAINLRHRDTEHGLAIGINNQGGMSTSREQARCIGKIGITLVMARQIKNIGIAIESRSPARYDKGSIKSGRDQRCAETVASCFIFRSREHRPYPAVTVPTT